MTDPIYLNITPSVLYKDFFYTYHSNYHHLPLNLTCRLHISLKKCCGLVVSLWFIQDYQNCRKLKGSEMSWHLRYREYVCSVVVCQKYLTRLGELIIFEPLRENLSFLPTGLDIFDIRQH